MVADATFAGWNAAAVGACSEPGTPRTVIAALSLATDLGIGVPIEHGLHSTLTTYGAPVRFGSRAEMVAGLMRAVAPPGGAPLVRTWRLSYGLPRLARVLKGQRAALCEVARMLTDRLGLPAAIGGLFAHVDERWDARREAIPLPVRIVQVARVVG